MTNDPPATFRPTDGDENVSITLTFERLDFYLFCAIAAYAEMIGRELEDSAELDRIGEAIDKIIWRMLKRARRPAREPKP